MRGRGRVGIGVGLYVIADDAAVVDGGGWALEGLVGEMRGWGCFVEGFRWERGGVCIVRITFVGMGRDG